MFEGAGALPSFSLHPHLSRSCAGAGQDTEAFPGLFPRICPNRNNIRVSWAKGKRTWGYERPNLSHSSPRLTSGAQALAFPATPASWYWDR